jgi:hypothetical protein
MIPLILLTFTGAFAFGFLAGFYCGWMGRR